MEMFETKIMNSAGSGKILLNAQEVRIANYNQRKVNALGYDIDITSLTAVSKKVIEQKFFEIVPSDFMPVVVGDNAWASSIVTFQEYATGGGFEDGLINTSTQNARQAMVDTAIDSVVVPVIDWAKTITWSLPELQKASKAGNWDIVTAKEKARKKNWDLGIQRAAFLGLPSIAGFNGLLNQTGVTDNTTYIAEDIGDMDDAEFSAFIKGLIGLYRTNASFTAWPDRFLMPEGDYLKLAAPSSVSFPIKSRLEIMLDTFKVITMNPNFKILPLPYLDAVVSGLAYDRYVLYNSGDSDSLRMEIPVDYTNTAANSLNSYHFQNVGFGEFTPVKAYRPKEMMYFSDAT